MRKITLGAYLLIALFTNCGREETSKTETTPTKLIDIGAIKETDSLISPRELMTDVHYISLSSNDTFFIAQAKKVVEYDNRLFILDKKKAELVVYSMDGNFLGRVGAKGEGPGEYMSATDFEIDLKRNLIIVFSRGDLSILEYNRDLSFNRKIRLDIWAFQMALLESGNLAFYTYFINEGLNDNLLIYGRDGKEIESRMPYPKGEYVPMDYTGFIEGNYYSYPLSSKIYMLDEKQEEDKVAFEIKFPNQWPEEKRFNFEDFKDKWDTPILGRFTIGEKGDEVLFMYSYKEGASTYTTFGVKLASDQIFGHLNLKHGGGNDSDIFVKLFFLNSYNLAHYSESSGYYYMLTDVDAMSWGFYSDIPKAMKEINEIDPELGNVLAKAKDHESPIVVKFKLRKSI